MTLVWMCDVIGPSMWCPSGRGMTCSLCYYHIWQGASAGPVVGWWVWDCGCGCGWGDGRDSKREGMRICEWMAWLATDCPMTSLITTPLPLLPDFLIWQVTRDKSARCVGVWAGDLCPPSPSPILHPLLHILSPLNSTASSQSTSAGSLPVFLCPESLNLSYILYPLPSTHVPLSNTTNSRRQS